MDTNFEILASVQTKGQKSRIATLSEEYYVTANEVYEEEGGSMSVYRLKFGPSESDPSAGLEVEFVTALQGRLICPALFGNHKLFYIEAQEVADPSDPLNKHRNDETRAFTYRFTLFDLIGLAVEKSYLLEENVTQIVSFDISESRKYASILFLNNKVIILNDRAEKIAAIKISVSGAIFAILFDQEDLYFSSKKDQLTKVSIPALEAIGVTELEYSGDSEQPFFFFETLRCQGSFISKNMMFLRWVEKDRLLLCGDQDGIYLNDFEFLTHQSRAMMQLTACGISLNPEKSMVAVGDFVGTFRIFPAQENNPRDALYEGFVPASIRALA